MREVFYILIIRAFVKGFIVSNSQSRRQQINPSIGAERIMASVRLWPKFLQREGLSLHVAAIAFPPKATARKQDAEREFKHLYNWMKTAVCNEPATLIALPTDEPANPNTAQIYRAVIGIPLGKLTTAKLTEHLQGYNAKQKDASFSVRPITTYDKDDLSRALSKLGRLKRREHFVLSEDGLRWSEDGLPIICSGREIMPAPSLLQLQAGFRALLRDHGAALRRGESLTCLSLGLFPTVSLIITPTTDLVERVLSGEFKGNESRDASGGRLITKDVLRQATLCIPSLGA